eukprot:10074831-Alexandrium_andersonii.AAC.1
MTDIGAGPRDRANARDATGTGAEGVTMELDEAVVVGGGGGGIAELSAAGVAGAVGTPLSLSTRSNSSATACGTSK